MVRQVKQSGAAGAPCLCHASSMHALQKPWPQGTLTHSHDIGILSMQMWQVKASALFALAAAFWRSLAAFCCSC